MNTIWVVFCSDEESASGVSFTGIFNNKGEALSWAESEGPEYEVMETQFGPIEWDKFNPLPPWSEEILKAEAKTRKMLKPNSGWD